MYHEVTSFICRFLSLIVQAEPQLLTVRGVACVKSEDPKVPAYPLGTLAYEFQIDDINLDSNIHMDLGLNIYRCAKVDGLYGWLLIPSPISLYAYMQRAYETPKEWKTRGYWDTHSLEKMQSKYVYDIQYRMSLKKFLSRAEYADWKSGKSITTYTKLDLASERGYHSQGYQILKLSIQNNHVTAELK